MRTFNFRKEEPLLNIASYAHSGSRAADRLTPAQIEHIRLTVSRAPEVMVKVLSQGSSDLKAVGRHFDYIGRQGDLELESDDGYRLQGSVGKELIDDWGLDIDKLRPQANLTALPGRKPIKLVHKLVFSMPAGTPPQKVLSAVRNFAREEFHGQHRYVAALHTDEPHPHVHVLVKAMSEQGVRLHIRKATLRGWREEFARQLRVVGVAANATPRFVRGETKPRKSDGINRAARRGESTHMRERVMAAAAAMGRADYRPESGKARLEQTREAVAHGWGAIIESLGNQGHADLAGQARKFVGAMPAVRTEREWLTAVLREPAREPRGKVQERTR